MGSVGGIGGGSIMHVAASVASSIAGSESLTGAKASDIHQGPSIGESIRSAFDNLVKMQQNEPAAAGVAAIEPFSPPDVAADSLMGSLKDAVVAFRELAGGKQKWNVDVSDQQHAVQSDAQRTGLSAQRGVGLGPDKQKLSDLGNQQFAELSGAQRVGDLGSQQLAQLSGAQKIGDLGSQQLAQLSGAQRVEDLGGQQFAQFSGAQKIGDLGSQQLAPEIDKQRVAQAEGADPRSASGPPLLDQCNKFFHFLDQIVAGDKDLSLKTTQILR